VSLTRSQNILNPSDDIGVDIVSPDELLKAKKPERDDCCDFAFLRFSCVADASVLRFDIIDRRKLQEGETHQEADPVQPV